MQPRIHVDASDIGKVLYPADNSFVLNITDNKEAIGEYLAGHSLSKPAPSVPVTIVSGEYERYAISSSGKRTKIDCVTVLYKDKLYSIINVFTAESELTVEDL